MNKQNENLIMALEYAKRGWSVIPINPGSKKPMIAWRGYQNEKATSEQITEWWTNRPNANIGVVTGAISGLIVIDIEKGGDISMYPPTVISRTGGGGYHYIYKYPNQQIKNAARIWELTDIRSDGGYIVAPPSTHPSGNHYEWTKSPFETEIAEMPDDILQKILNKQNYHSSENQNAGATNGKTVLEGERNTTAARMAGKIISQLPASRWEEDGWPELLDWNEKYCQPSLVENELKNVWESIKKAEISNKQNNKKSNIEPSSIITISEEDESKNEVAPKITIENLPPKTFLTDLLAYTNKVTDAPDEYIITAGLACMATVLKNNVYFAFGEQHVRPHLYMLLLGSSSLLRKTTCVNMATKILYKAASQLSDEFILSNDITPESFTEALSQRPYGLFSISEFGGLLSRMGKTYNLGFKEFITELYDSLPKYTKTRKDKKGELTVFEIIDPTINILAGSTLEWFNASLAEGDIASGFLPRFIFAYVDFPTKETNILPQSADETRKNELVNQLTILGQNWNSEKVFSEQAKKLYIDWARANNHHIRNCKNPCLDAFYSRLSVVLIKLALIIEGSLRVREYLQDGNGVFNNSNMITEEAMLSAIDLVDYYKKTSKLLVSREIATNPYNKKKVQILKILRKNKGEISRRDLLREFHESSEYLDKILRTMEESGEISVFSQKSISGREIKMVKTNQ